MPADISNFIITLPCMHKFTYEHYSIMTINQIIMNKSIHCLECNKEYQAIQTNILIKVYSIIKEEKKKYKEILSKKKLDIDNKIFLIEMRKKFYLFNLNKQKNIKKMDKELVLYMFNILFNTTYFI